ncbi:hypothetical protein TNCV_3286151 [Trichonephila clavipes]|nr:hypothetical protein TNCV_3286151 [Trichonephila clavipes]
MLITFFDSQGVIHKEFLPEGTTMNAARFQSLSVQEKETPNSTTLSKKIAQGNLTASCKRLTSWFLLYKGTKLGRKIVPVRPPKF